MGPSKVVSGHLAPQACSPSPSLGMKSRGEKAGHCRVPSTVTAECMRKQDTFQAVNGKFHGTGHKPEHSVQNRTMGVSPHASCAISVSPVVPR